MRQDINVQKQKIAGLENELKDLADDCKQSSERRIVVLERRVDESLKEISLKKRF